MTLALQITGLSKNYRGKTQALDNVSLHVKQGDFFALLGANGAGKTTMLGILCGLVNKTAGKVEIFGTDIDTNFALAKTKLAIVPQELNFNIFEKVINIVLNQAGYYGIPKKVAAERAEYYLKKMDLWHKRFMPSMSLSGGMKRRLMIVRALVSEPQLLILDEPTAGVDIELRRHMWQFLKELNAKGTTIILTTHYLEEAEQLCNNIAIIDHGKVIADTSMRELLAKLPTQVFVLETAQDIENVPEISGYECSLLTSRSMEVEVDAEQDLNAVFTSLSEHNITITSLRPKSGRLEELFMSLTNN